MNYRVNIIIPTYKPGHDFLELLTRLNQQTIIPDNIIIINTEEKYLLESTYAGFSNVRIHHIKAEEFDHAATRHKGISMAESDYVILMTQDAMPSNEFLIEELLKPFANEQVALTYARQLPKDDCNIVEKYTRSFNYPNIDIIKSKENIKELGIKTYFCSDVCAAYRLSIYKELDGFVKKTIFNEDTLYAAKAIEAGYKVYYASNAIITHSHNYSGIQYFHRNFDLGVSHKQFKHVFEGSKSEDEGFKLVKNSAKYLLSINKWFLLPNLIINSGFKYIGYKLGLNFDKLPKWLVLKCTMNKRYWEE